MARAIYRKGIILAGGTGTRLYPLTKVLNKHLLPLYDKPMIYYPLSTLMLADIREILIVTNEESIDQFKQLLGNGNKLGISIEYAIQKEPNGLASGLLIGEKFAQNSHPTLILGDNFFHGQDLVGQLKFCYNQNNGATLIAYPVFDPERYAVIEIEKNGKVLSIEEKPINPKSVFAATGLYFYDQTVMDRAKELSISARNEFEITDLNKSYLLDNELTVKIMSRGMSWIDTGTNESLIEAGNYIKMLESRQGLKIGCIEEIAWRKSWISDESLEKLALDLSKNEYGKYLLKTLEFQNKSLLK